MRACAAAQRVGGIPLWIVLQTAVQGVWLLAITKGKEEEQRKKGVCSGHRPRAAINHGRQQVNDP